MIRSHQSRTSRVSGEGLGKSVCCSKRRPCQSGHFRWDRSQEYAFRSIKSNTRRDEIDNEQPHKILGLSGSRQHGLKSGDVSRVYNWPESPGLYNRKCPGTYKGRIDGEVNPSILRGSFLLRVEIAAKGEPHRVAFLSRFMIFSLLLSSPELSDTKVYAP